MGEHMNSLIPHDVIKKLTVFSGEHTFATSVISPPFDFAFRNNTAWLAPNISIGGQSFNSNGTGGPRLNQAQYNPGVIQWNTGDEVGFISVSSVR